MNKKELKIKVFTTKNEQYKITLIVDAELDEESAVDDFIDENLKNIKDWEWI